MNIFFLRSTFYLFSCLIFTSLFAQNVKRGKLDASQYVILPFTKNSAVFIPTSLKKALATPLSRQEVDDMEYMIDTCCQSFNKNNKYKEVLKPLGKYKRQYIAFINEKGEKEVWVNFLCDPQNTYWRKGIPIVADGGNCYFNLFVNLTLKKVYNIRVNGYA